MMLQQLFQLSVFFTCVTLAFCGHTLHGQDLAILDQPEIEACLKLAGENRAELETAIKQVPKKHAKGLEFLLVNMSQNDLEKLDAAFLLDNLKLAYRARAKAAWSVPDEIFLNNVLPHANIDEPRDPWRKEMYAICKPIVKGCKTPSEAAQRLNEKVFNELSVKYSTKRKRANQSPKESIEQGLASCTGLSIILVDACRSVGVPARLVGIPSWKNKRGNHTWVEIWDGQWHFTGAAEYNSEGLNRAWFQNDAALADPDSKMHSIYAVSFQKTATRFPMVWSPDKAVFAENVTKRYLSSVTAKSSSDKVNLMVRAWDKGRKTRQVVDVEIACEKCEQDLKGKTKAGTADMNDMLTFELDPDTSYEMRVFQKETGGKKKLLAKQTLVVEDFDQMVEIEIDNTTDKGTTLEPSADKPKQKPGRLTDSQTTMLSRLAGGLFVDTSSADQLLAEHPAQARKIAWQQYLDSGKALSYKSDFDANQVTFEKHLSPYTIKEVGERPENGWPLFIAMHGGGGTSQAVNDSQWKHMQIYYKDQAELKGYKYLALRAPNNSWNGFYDDYVYPLVENLVKQFIVFGDIDPNKVFIMGYSHGGYGAFAIGPKIPYRFAAVHASAAAPTDGQTSAKTLRNTRFTFMVGEKDTAYGRRKRCEKFAAQIDELKSANQGSYPVEFMFKKGFGHGGLPDRDMISQMYDHDRNAIPKHLTWEMTDSVVNRFFWLKANQPAKGQMIDAKIDGNKIVVESENCRSFSILVDGRTIDPSKPIELVVDGTTNSIDYKPTFKTLCHEIMETGDLNLSFDFEIQVNLAE
jgi:predicted peptidase